MKKTLLASFISGVFLLSFSMGQLSVNNEIKEQAPNYFGDPGLNLYFEKEGDPNTKVSAPIGFWVFDEKDPSNFSIITGGNIPVYSNTPAYYKLPDETYLEVGEVSKMYYDGSTSYTIVDIYDTYELRKSYIPVVDSTPFSWYTYAYTEDAFTNDEKMFKIAVDGSNRLVNATYAGKRTEENGNKTYLLQYDGYIDDSNLGAPVFYSDIQQNNVPILAGVFNGPDVTEHDDGHKYWRFTPVWEIADLGYVPYVWWTSGD